MALKILDQFISEEQLGKLHVGNFLGWNANKGNEIFSTATAYPDDTYKLTSLNAASKSVGKPNALHALDQSFDTELQPHGYNVSKANIERIRSRNPNLLGSEALDQVLPTPGTLPPASGPSVATANATKVTLSPEKMSFIETLKAEKAATEKSAREALPATKKSIEESGYLYHYAPREARGSIVSGGFDVSKARTAVGDIVVEASEFATHVPENSMYFYTRPEDAPSSGTIFGTGETGQRPDLYRTKIEPGMLDDMVVDPRLPVRDGVGSAVIVPSKTGKFEAELIGENAKFGIRGDNISPATYDPIHAASSVATDNATKVTPLADEYDTGTVAAKIAAGEPVTAPPPVSPSPKPVAAISQRRLEALEKMAEYGPEREAAIARAKLEQIKAGQSTTPPPPRGPTIGTPTNVTTGASAQGPRAGKPVQPTGAAVVDTTLMSDAEKATMSGVKGGDGISVVDPGLGAKIKSNPGLTAREAMGTIGKEIKTFTKAQGKVNRKIAGQELSSAVAAGFKQSKNLRLLGLGALVGVGYGASRAIHRENEDLQS